ncbi:MAG: phosphate transport system substrate-binding protein [Actinomycetota bacterium]|nr:phosphate transport system substrate-binding protein [Actinomycetota bacterium]MDQ1562745.1 phosphate transport system substrate-binding protein [Actinomycetota bacterium]
MKLKNLAVAGTIAIAATVALAACSSASPTSTASPAAPLSGTITSGGSSAQANAQTAWAAAFQAQNSGVTINYDKSQGSGGGVTNFLSGTYDFAGTDAALTSDQQTQSQTLCGAGGALDLPVYLSGVAIIFNVPGVTKLNLDSASIAKIFNKKITMWNDPALVALNPGVTLPSAKITPVVRSDGSGTTNNFTTYLSQVQKANWPYPASSAWPVTGESAQQGGSGVVSTVAAGKDTIGYADQSSIAKATAADIQLGTTSTYVTYSAAGATAAFTEAASANPSTKGDLTQALDYTKISGTNSYPIPLLSYDVVCTTFKTAAQAKLTKAYVGFIDSTIGQAVAAKNAGSAPLPASILADVKSSLASVK